MKWILPGFAVLLALPCPPVEACSWGSIPPIELPDKVYAFEGVVRRIVPAGETAALEIDVTVPLIGVEKAAPVRVLVFGTGMSCQRTSYRPIELKKHFPRGTAVAVIGRPVISNPQGRDTTLEVWEREGDYLEVRDHSALPALGIPSYRELQSDDRYQDGYRYLKLLVRLNAAKDEMETARVLRQMVPFFLLGSVDHFGMLVARYAKSEGQRKELIAAHEQAYRQVYKLDEPPRTGTQAESISVELEEGHLRINDTQIDFPIKITLLEEVLGPPSGIVAAAAGDKDSNDVLEWEHLGFFLYSKPGSGEGHGLGVALAPDFNSRRWETAFSGRIAVNGVEISRFSGADDLKRASFTESDYGPWKVSSRSLYFMLMTYPNPEQITDVEIGQP